MSADMSAAFRDGSKAGAYYARHGRNGLLLQVVEAAAAVMAARERMERWCDCETELVDSMGKLMALMSFARQTVAHADDVREVEDAWEHPGLYLAKLIMGVAWYLRDRRTMGELAADIVNAQIAVRRVSAPLCGAVEAATTRWFATLE